MIAEFEGLIDEFAIIDQGRLRLTMEADQARERFKRIHARFAHPPPALDLAGALSVKSAGREVEVLADGAAERLLAVLGAAHPEEVRSESLTLEEIFVATNTLNPSRS